MYRPNINEKTAKAVLVVLHKGLEHVELPEKDLVLVLRFMNKLSEQDQIARVLERLGMDAPDVDEEETTTTEEAETTANMSEWSIETLEHFIMVYRDDPSPTKTLQVEIAERELVRKREQIPRLIRPRTEE